MTSLTAAAVQASRRRDSGRRVPAWGHRGAAGLLLGLALGLSASAAQVPEAPPPEPASPCFVLLTLDTTRADHLGAYGNRTAKTPHLDALAARGTRWARALTPTPLTLPAHASLLTGLEPPEHGVRDNGTAVLPEGVPTLATVLAGQGWTTAAFVASRVLDRRFGLARGFTVYDDRMAAERVGEYGYPERDAAAVTAAATAWLAERDPARPFFLWVHYYDPHLPYAPPPGVSGGGPDAAYAGEITWMDRQIGGLLAALPGKAAGEGCLVAAVGDHGEALGEHGEASHGIFLYRAALEVPLIFAGPVAAGVRVAAEKSVPAGKVIEETVSSRRLAPTVLELLGLGGKLPGAGPVLPGFAAGDDDDPPPEPVYSESRLPATAHGWSPLAALTEDGWRLIRAPRPELYDLAADPAESRNLFGEEPARARRLAKALKLREAAMAERRAPLPPPDAELEAALRSLGYLSGASGSGEGRQGAIDPKDGIALLADFERGKELLAAGRAAEARDLLAGLVGKNPDNVPFISRLAAAQLAAGDGEAAVATYRRAVSRNPRLHFLHLHLADAYASLGRTAEARRAYEVVLELHPRSAAAWLRLAEMAHRAGEDAEERRLLEAAVATGTASAVILARLAQVETAAGQGRKAEQRLGEALELTPEWALLWYLRGRLRRDSGDLEGARRDLERAAALAPSAQEGREARRLLATPPPPPPSPPPRP